MSQIPPKPKPTAGPRKKKPQPAKGPRKPPPNDLGPDRTVKRTMDSDLRNHKKQYNKEKKYQEMMDAKAKGKNKLKPVQGPEELRNINSMMGATKAQKQESYRNMLNDMRSRNVLRAKSTFRAKQKREGK